MKTDDVKFNPVHKGAVKTAWKPTGLNHAARRKISRNNDPNVLMRRLQFALDAVRLQKAQIAEALGEAREAQCQATASAQELKDAHARIRAQAVQVDVLQEDLNDVERQRSVQPQRTWHPNIGLEDAQHLLALQLLCANSGACCCHSRHAARGLHLVCLDCSHRDSSTTASRRDVDFSREL